MRNCLANKSIHVNTTTISTGSEIECTQAETITLEIVGTSTSRTILFQGKTENGIWYDVYGVCRNKNITDKQTTGKDEVWVLPLLGFTYFRCNITAISGGTISIFGKLEG